MSQWEPLSGAPFGRRGSGKKGECGVNASGCVTHGMLAKNNSGLHKTGMFRSGIKGKERERIS